MLTNFASSTVLTLIAALLLARLPAACCQSPGGGGWRSYAPATITQDLDSMLVKLTNSKYGFCIENAERDLNETFDFSSDLSFITDCMEQTRGDMLGRLCNKAEVLLYVSGLGSSGGRISRNCNPSSWALGCQPGWACSWMSGQNVSEDELVPLRAENCRPCCPGFFCPRGLTCMIPCPLGAYCPLGKLNDTTGLCDPYFYQVSPGPNHICGGADSWADVGRTNDIFCPPGYYCPTTTQKVNCSKGSYCRKGSTEETKCFWKSSCKDNSTKEDIALFGGILIVGLSIILLLIYNCSGQFIAIRVKMLTKSRKKAAKIAKESVKARERWKLAKELVLKHELEMARASDPEQSAASSDSDNGSHDEAFHPEDKGKRPKRSHVNKKKLMHLSTERFKHAYSRIEKEHALQQDDHKLTFSKVVSVAAECRTRQRPMLEVAFKGLTLSIGQRKLLQCVTGKISPHRITAVMGPSGAGKTTFLNAVLGKTAGYKKNGLVLINGKPGSMQSYKKIIGFVPQDDIVHGNLTVEENLWFSACCRLGRGMLKGDKIMVLERVIGSLGLQEIRNSMVGTVEKRGISGGQRKRVNVGLEMVMEPSLLILDEPTTGLDSASSQLLLRALRREALEGVNVCMVVHQPSYTLFNMCDDFILLARGGLIAYHGPVDRVETYFAGIGIDVPERQNPPDYYIDILEGIVKTTIRGGLTPRHLPLLWMLHNGYDIPQDMRKDLEEINTSHELYTIGSISVEQSIAEGLENRDSLDQNIGTSISSLHRKTPGVLAQYKYYLGRVAKQRLREAKQQAIDYLILGIAGICVGTITKVRDDSFGAPSYGYTIVAVSLLCQLAALRSFSPERLQYWRERESGMSTLAYFLARDTIDHFNTVVKPIVFLSTFYFFNNPRSTLADNYIVFLALVYCVTGIGYTFAIWFELGLAQLCSALLPVVLFLVGTQKGIPQPLKDLCFPKWTLEAFVIAQAKRYSGVWLITRCGILLTQNYNIHSFGFCIAILFLYGLFFRFVSLLSLLKLK